jgi:hypothetical protein
MSRKECRDIYGLINRAGDYVVEHGEDLIGQFPHEHDAVNFATLRNDGVKQWEGNARTFPALTVVSRGDKPAAAGPARSATGQRDLPDLAAARRRQLQDAENGPEQLRGAAFRD